MTGSKEKGKMWKVMSAGWFLYEEHYVAENWHLQHDRLMNWIKGNGSKYGERLLRLELIDVDVDSTHTESSTRL